MGVSQAISTRMITAWTSRVALSSMVGRYERGIGVSRRASGLLTSTLVAVGFCRTKTRHPALPPGAAFIALDGESAKNLARGNPAGQDAPTCVGEFQQGQSIRVCKKPIPH